MGDAFSGVEAEVWREGRGAGGGLALRSGEKASKEGGL